MSNVAHNSHKTGRIPARTRASAAILAILAIILGYRTLAFRVREHALERASLQGLLATVRDNPDDTQAQRILARRARAAGSYRVALDAYNHVAAAEPSNEQVWIELAETASAAGQPRAARDVLLTFCRSEPDSGRARAALSTAYLQTGDAASALGAATEALKLDPNLAEAWLAKGAAAEAAIAGAQMKGSYSQAKDLEEQAGKAYRRGVALAPRDWRGYAGLGSLAGMETRYRESIGNLRTALSLHSDDGMLESRLGTALLVAGTSPAERDEAVRLLERAASRGDNLAPAVRVSTYLRLGQAYQDGGQWSKALPWLKRAAELDPARPDVHYELAGVYQELGDHASAARERQIHQLLSERNIEKQRQMDRADAAAVAASSAGLRPGQK